MPRRPRIHARSLPEVDAFPASARLRSYVPLPSQEQVLAYLRAKLVEQPGIVELSGPSGVGKSLLMRVVAERLAERFVRVRAPIPTFPPDQFATWVAGASRGPHAWRPARLWKRWRQRSLPRLLLVEDAQELPEATRAWIESWCAESGGRAVLAFTEELGARQSSARRVFLEPLELSEIAAYVENHLEQIDAPAEIRELFRGERAHSLALGSRGIPRAIHRLADERLLALAASDAASTQTAESARSTPQRPAPSRRRR